MRGLKLVAISAFAIVVVFARVEMANAYYGQIDTANLAESGGKNNSKDSGDAKAKAEAKAEAKSNADANIGGSSSSHASNGGNTPQAGQDMNTNQTGSKSKNGGSKSGTGSKSKGQGSKTGTNSASKKGTNEK